MRNYPIHQKLGKGLIRAVSLLFATVFSFGMLLSAVTVQPLASDLPETAVPPDGKAVIRKTDEKGGLLAGARLQILDKSKKEVLQEFTSAEYAQVFTLRAGTYFLHEAEAPEGYAAAGDMMFEVRAGGVIDPSKTYSAMCSYRVNEFTPEFTIVIDGEEYPATCAFPPNPGPDEHVTEYEAASEEAYMERYGVDPDRISKIKTIIKEYRSNGETLTDRYFTDTDKPELGLYWAARMAIQETVGNYEKREDTLNKLAESYPSVEEAFSYFLGLTEEADTDSVKLIYMLPADDPDRYQPLIVLTDVSEWTEVTMVNTPEDPKPETPEDPKPETPEDPKPETPEEPKPATPTIPEVPVTPTTPSTPTIPTAPTTPTTPVTGTTTVTSRNKTTEPEVKEAYQEVKVTDSSESSVKGDYADDTRLGTKSTGKGANTGDSSGIYLWAAAMSASAVLCAAVIIRRRKGSG